MSSLPIQFFSEDISYTLKNKAKVRSWLNQAIREEGRRLKELNFIFCNDQYLLEINQNYLKHDTFTDIVTFDNSDSERITGDIFISIDRVKENAGKFGVNFVDELHRVMIHGTLHLLGYLDKTKAQKEVMTGKENYYLALRAF